MNRFIRSVAGGALTVAVVAACDSTTISSDSGDRIGPTVTVAIVGQSAAAGASDSVNVRLPFRVTVTAQDNAALNSVLTRVLVEGVAIQRDSSVLTAASSSFTKSLTFALPGVRSGQTVTAAVTAYDGSGNATSDQVSVRAFDPAVPRVQLLNPDGQVITGGTYNFSIQANDSLGLSKIGYRATGAVARADSAMADAPLPKNDTLNFSLTVPGSATVGSSFTIEPFAENRDGLRSSGTPVQVRIAALGADQTAPIVFQNVPPRMEFGDSLELTARDLDGLVRVVGYLARDAAGNVLHRSADTLSAQAQQVIRKKVFDLPTSLRGLNIYITGYAIDASGKTGYAVPTGSTIPQTSDLVAKRDLTVYAFGLTSRMPAGSLGADIAVDTVRSRVYISNINKNQLEVYNYASTMSPLAPVAVGAMPWGMMIDNSGSLLLVANSGGTNISKVNLISRVEEGRVKTANEWIYDIQYTKDETSGGYKYTVFGPYDYSDRPQYIAQSASGALYYSTRPTSEAEPGTLRRIDNFLDARTEPRQIWQYGYRHNGHFVVINADGVDVIKGATGEADRIIICDHTVGNSPTTAVCVTELFVPDAIAALRTTPVNGNAEAIKDLSYESLALPDTNFVAVGGDRRRVAFGEANTGGRAGRVMVVTDPTGTPAYQERYSAPIEVVDLTNNASDKVFGIAINGNSTNIGVHGAETFFADSSLRLQGKFATFNTGAGIAFHPRNIDEQVADTSARVAFVASGDYSIQIVDSYSYRLRGRIPIRANLYGALRAVTPSAAQQAADPSLVVKLFGLTPEGIVMIDVRRGDIDNVPR